MNSKFNFLFAAILVSIIITAQKVNFGIKGGLNGYTFNNDNNADYDAKTGFHPGLSGHIHMSGQLALQPERFTRLKVQNIQTP